MSKANVDLPKGCMQPARDAIVEALTQLCKAVAMGCTKGIVIVDFYGFRVIVTELKARNFVYRGKSKDRFWVISSLSSTQETRKELADIALAIAPDYVQGED